MISDPVPTPEQLAQILGVSPERLVEIRQIMNQQSTEQSSAAEGTAVKEIAKNMRRGIPASSKSKKKNASGRKTAG